MNNFESLLHLLAACWNPACGKGCGFFLSGSTPVVPNTPCLICGCFAAQHVPPATTTSAPTAASSAQAQATQTPGGFSATSATGSAGSGLPRSGPSTYTSRQPGNPSNSSTLPSSNTSNSSLAGQNSSPTIFRDLLKSTSRFNPTEKSMQDYYASLPGKKTNGKAPPTGSKVFTSFFVPYTSLASSGELRRFSLVHHRALEIAGLVVKSTFHPGLTDQQIYNALLNKYAHIPEIRELGIRLLCLDAAGQGASPRLIPLNMEVSYQALGLASAGTTIRYHGSVWPSLFYFTLPAGGPDFIVADKDLLRAPDGEMTEPPAEPKHKRKDPPIVISDSEDADSKPAKKRQHRPRRSSESDTEHRPTSSKTRGKRKASELDPETEDDPSVPPKRSKAKSAPKDELDADKTPKPKAGDARAPTPPPVTTDDDADLPEPGRFTKAAKAKAKASAETPFEQGFYDEDIADGFSSDDDDAKPASSRRGPAPRPTASATSSGSARPTAASPPPRPTYSPNHRALIRILANMTTSGRSPLFADQPRGLFVRGLPAGAMVTTFCNVASNSETGGVISPNQLPEFITATFAAAFDPLHELIGRMGPVAERNAPADSEAEFDAQIFLGPGGIHAIMPHVDAAYLILRDLSWRGIPGLSVDLAWNALDRLSSALLYAARHVRFRHRRSIWDATQPLRDFHAFLDGHDAELPAATSADYDRLRLGPVVAAIQTYDADVLLTQLIQSFGDAADWREMSRERILRGGAFGIRRVFDTLVVPLLDEHDITQPGYSAIFDILNTFIDAVVHLLRNWQKSNKKATPGPSKPAPSSTKPRSSRRRPQ